MTQPTTPRVGIALSGGIAKVLAHVGVLQALEESGVPLHAVAATSGGSIVGAFFAAGWTPAQLAEVAQDVSWKRLTRVTLPRLGLLSNERMESFVTDRLGDARFEELKLPFAVIAANLTTGQKAVFRTGRIGPPIRASCSIPQLFSPVVINGDVLADGGLVEYLPIETLDDLGCDVKIGVNLGGIRNWRGNDPKNLFEVALRVVSFVSQRNAALSEQHADVVIRPDLTEFGPYDLHRSAEMIRVGYEAGRAAAPEILARIRERAAPEPESDWARMVRWFRERSPLQAFGRKLS